MDAINRMTHINISQTHIYFQNQKCYEKGINVNSVLTHTIFMCGRFHLGFSRKDTQKLLHDIPDEQQIMLKFGDIYPTSFAPILTAEEVIVARWGFERFDRKGVLINARAETVTERQTFRKSFLERRCLIPANGFYEWDSEKRKYYFTRNDGGLLYLCGFYRVEDGEHRFIILTKNATPPVAKYHNRIPVIAENHIKHKYLTDLYFASDYIHEGNKIKLKTG